MEPRTRFDDIAFDLVASAAEVLKVRNDLRDVGDLETVDRLEDELVGLFDRGADDPSGD